MSWATWYAIFLIVIGGYIFFYAIGFINGLRWEKNEHEKWSKPQFEYFAEQIIELEDENRALRKNNMPVKGVETLAKNILTRRN